MSTVQNILVLGGGTAGLTAALTLKRKLPQLKVRVVRSPDIGVIGVGESTNMTFPKHFLEDLAIPLPRLMKLIDPTLKLGIRFLWGPRPEFHYAFACELAVRHPALKRSNAAYREDGPAWTGPVSALMAHELAFHRGANGKPRPHRNFAFHIENPKMVAGLEVLCQEAGVALTDGTVGEAERADHGVAALRLQSGERVTADLFVDASGFRAELIGKTLEEPWIPYTRSLYSDRAVLGSWEREDETVSPYTLAETMEAGWCWRIEHSQQINRGYVYSSSFISDDRARAEFLRKNPKVKEDRTHVVKFTSGRRARLWVGNVVAVGNASGFVEPLEATAIGALCLQSGTLASALEEAHFGMSDPMRALFNKYNGDQWDDIRDFLALHYKFNQRLDTEFWRTARRDVDLAGASALVEFWQQHGPSGLPHGILTNPAGTFGLEGYYAMLSGMDVPVARPYQPTAAERQTWRTHVKTLGDDVRNGVGVLEGLRILRGES